jgi:AsmA protein
LEGTLAFDNLDLAPYISGPQPASTLAFATEWLSTLRFAGGVTPSLINEIDADIRISAANVSVGNRTLGRCAASFSIKDSKLVADLAEIELETGGTGEGQIGMNMTGSEPRYTIRGKLDGLDMGKTIGAYLGRSAVEGYGTLALDLSGAGRTGDAILESLAGSIALDMLEGARLGVDVEGLAKAAAGSAPNEASQPSAEKWSALMEQATAVDNLVARFAASGGVFTAQSLSAGVGETDVIAAGAVDLSRRALDLTVSLARGAAKEPAAGKEGFNRAFRVHGPWQAPGISGVPPPGKSAAPGDFGASPIGTVPSRDRG